MYKMKTLTKRNRKSSSPRLRSKTELPIQNVYGMELRIALGSTDIHGNIFVSKMIMIAEIYAINH